MYTFYIVPIKEPTYLTFHEFKNIHLQSDTNVLHFFFIYYNITIILRNEKKTSLACY